MQYTMTCSCGDTMPVDAESRADAVTKLQTMMNADAVAAHMAEKHPGEAIPTVEMVHSDIEKNLQPA